MADQMTSLTSKRVIKQGLLMKRCRFCWRPRFIEIVSDPPDFSGPQYNFYLLIYDQSHKTIKKRVRVKDIVTIRAGKHSSFQVYLNSGMFILFRADSVESQTAWMAELKMALGRGNIFHVQVSTPADNFVLDHALLYCIGVNLPNHHYGQLDRVLVVASPINDVNLHAWNLSRVKRFLIVEAGIQMELCGNCMGHRKKTVTFLISPNFVQDCTDFLVKEARMSSEPKRMSSDGPIYYSLPHSCSMVAESGDTTAMFPTYTNAERIVLGNKSTGAAFYVNHDVRVRSYSTSTTASSHRPPPPPAAATLHPSLPPRTVLRMHNESSVNHGFLPSPKETGRNMDTVPYQINHRIYVNQTGGMTQDSHIFGSGSWEHSHSGSRAPIVPPRMESTRVDSPMYIHENDINSPMSGNLQGFQRPKFIGRNPPMLPPRGTDSDSPPVRRSKSDNNILKDTSSSPASLRRNSEFPHPRSTSTFADHETMSPHPELTPPTYDESVYYQNISHSHTGAGQRSPSPQMCTDDVTNAEFALITKLTFSGQVLPPRNQPRTPKPPMPVPRSKNRSASPEKTIVQCSSTLEADISVSTEPQQQGEDQKDRSFCVNPIYSTLVGNERETSSSSSSSTQTSPTLPRKAFQIRNSSFSSSSLTSEDYNKLIRKHTPLMKQYPHEV